MSKAKIGILLENGKIIVKMQIEKITQVEVSMLINHLEILKNELLSKFKDGLKRIEHG